MKFINLNSFVLIIYLISSNFAYSIDRPNIKNLIIHKDKKKIENVEFINSKGQKVSLNYYNSNIIIINFWATWCAPCIEEMPSLDKLKSNSELKDINIFPINIFTGHSVELAKKFQLRGIPTTILIDKKGYEFARIIGYIDFENKDFLDWLINSL